MLQKNELKLILHFTPRHTKGQFVLCLNALVYFLFVCMFSSGGRTTVLLTAPTFSSDVVGPATGWRLVRRELESNRPTAVNKEECSSADSSTVFISSSVAFRLTWHKMTWKGTLCRVECRENLSSGTSDFGHNIIWRKAIILFPGHRCN